MSLENLNIFGAGLSGLIAARMLNEHRPYVMEKQGSLPNNHAALLRFRSSIVGDVTNVEFKEVNVIKGVVGGESPTVDAIRYSLKVTGRLQERSINDLSPSKRYVAPPDLIARLASTAEIEFGVDFVQWSSALHKDDDSSTISTIPMPAMMEIFQWHDVPDFRYERGWSLTADISPQCESTINATFYCPDPNIEWYRATINGSKVIFEGVGDPPQYAEDKFFDTWCNSIGLHERLILSDSVKLKPSKYQKISELNHADKESAKRFIMWLSKEFNIYSLGRFAVWRPKLLLDDVVKDVRVIKRLIRGGTDYNSTVGKE